MLLANHGVLVFHRTPAQAVMIGGIVEEAAQDAINAIAIGGPREIEPEIRAAALQRAPGIRRHGDGALSSISVRFVWTVTRETRW